MRINHTSAARPAWDPSGLWNSLFLWICCRGERDPPCWEPAPCRAPRGSAGWLKHSQPRWCSHCRPGNRSGWFLPFPAFVPPHPTKKQSRLSPDPSSEFKEQFPSPFTANNNEDGALFKPLVYHFKRSLFLVRWGQSHLKFAAFNGIIWHRKGNLLRDFIPDQLRPRQWKGIFFLLSALNKLVFPRDSPLIITPQ